MQRWWEREWWGKMWVLCLIIQLDPPGNLSKEETFQLSSSRPNCSLSPFPGPNSRLLGWDPVSTLGISAMTMNGEYLLRKRFRLDGSDWTLLGTEFDTIRRKGQTWNVEFARHLRKRFVQGVSTLSGLEGPVHWAPWPEQPGCRYGLFIPSHQSYPWLPLVSLLGCGPEQ